MIAADTIWPAKPKRITIFTPEGKRWGSGGKESYMKGNTRVKTYTEGHEGRKMEADNKGER